ncbi:MAG: helix-turn-helix transcriptional regulator [Spirochaetaceae bacterium]|nr:helix-turn-helix transcriptional regulator [Spirochaetaceae bacterium]
MKHASLVKKFKALACEQRLRLIELLLEWEDVDTCCDGVRKAFTKASDEMNISRSTISHHFKELENAGLIHCVRNGQAVECKVDRDALEEIRSYLGE